jgi:hypothetical protein
MRLRVKHLVHDFPLDESPIELVFLDFHQRHAYPFHRVDWLADDAHLGIPMQHEGRELPHEFAAGAPRDTLVA